MKNRAATRYSGMVITDLDGTLLQSDRTISAFDLSTLKNLKKRQVLRVIATGRNLYSSFSVLPPDFPIDMLVFSTGAGILDWQKKEILISYSMNQSEIEIVFHFLYANGFDFMVQKAIPDNHFFYYFRQSGFNPDFDRRCEHYKSFAVSGDPVNFSMESATQFIVIEPPAGKKGVYEKIRDSLPAMRVIRTTSPLDHSSLWIEIFPNYVSKSRAGIWLSKTFGIDRK
ncbi:MAG: HAD hydrolase family protein, partial [Spirochaetota bacterium]